MIIQAPWFEDSRGFLRTIPELAVFFMSNGCAAAAVTAKRKNRHVGVVLKNSAGHSICGYIAFALSPIPAAVY
jgi:hypothetical protein